MLFACCLTPTEHQSQHTAAEEKKTLTEKQQQWFVKMKTTSTSLECIWTQMAKNQAVELATMGQVKSRKSDTV